MRLEKVEILGFKSFCDKQEVSFQGGVTGIVGPNGCGKSNISDAISWVLGEQSAKSLRGSSMEDVIFAGSQARQPLAMAEVSLKVSGLNGTSPDGHPDATVTRRLYRDGTSEYLINGELRRLKDIHEIFMDTGLGSKAYSIIEQGKIGLILSSKPADRRVLIEEAAGLTKYKVRRRQTQLKLEAAQQNLLRVNDIVHELEKQLESLKRQASKARRHRALRDEMQGVERVLFGRRFLELSEAAAGLETRIAEETERERTATIALETEEAQIEARRTWLYEEESRLEARRAALSDLTLSVDRHQNHGTYCKEQIKDSQARAAAARQEAEDLRGRLTPLASELEAHRALAEKLRLEVDAATAAVGFAEHAVGESARQETDLSAQLESMRAAQVDLLEKIAALQNAGTSLAGSADRAASDLVKLAAEFEDLNRERSKVESTWSESARRRTAAETGLEALWEEQRAVTARAAALRQAAEETEGHIATLRSECDVLAGRKSSLQEMVETHSAFDEGVRTLLATPEPLGVRGVVADFVETDSAHERAVEIFLNDFLQAVLVPDIAAARSAIEHLRDSGAGRCALLPLSAATADGSSQRLRDLAAEEPRVRGLLRDLVQISGASAAAIRSAIPDALVVETLGDAFDLVARRGPLPVVTLSGETLRGAVVEGGRRVRGLLAPRREIKEIEGRLEELDAQLAETRGREGDLESQAATAGAQARAIEERIHAAEKELVALRHDLAVAEEERSRIERKGLVLGTERSQAEEEREAAAARKAEIEAAIRAAEKERNAGGARLSSLAERVSEARAALEGAQAELAEARSRAAALKERSAAAAAAGERLEAGHRELVERLEASRAGADELDNRISQLSSDVASTEAALSAALLDRDRTSGEIEGFEGKVREARSQLDAREAAVKERRREREALRDAMSELTVLKARNDSDRDHLARESYQTLGQTAADCAATLTDEDRATEMTGIETRLAEMRERLERLGPVNVLAVEQSEELDERHNFMTAQRQDLVDSIAEMERAIKAIDRTSRERFEEAFRVINEHFGDIFRRLFGGGAAGLSLIDEEDLLESGIDVMAQPPGKRLQNVMLLSGGEKALTAIALLFAIFQYKPSPFCILDEVDAPLDDANIGRFVRMLEGLKENTQFILITHSRKTMEIADHLYGVTMEEPGVSKLVSVRLS